jgi:collagenase-like PrtC family protease
MILLREWGIERPLHLSTGVACFNSETIHYYAKKIGISRVIIPRKMNLKEMEILIKKCQDLPIEFEAIVMHSKCFFNDEYCFSWHSGGCYSLCSYYEGAWKDVKPRFPSLWKHTIEEILENPQSQFQEGSPLDSFLKITYFYPENKDSFPSQMKEKPDQKVRFHPNLASLIFKNCGLCSVKQLKEIGIKVFKIPLRGEYIEKERYIQLVRKVIDYPNPTREFCQDLINSPGFCSQIRSCYYYCKE